MKRKNLNPIEKGLHDQGVATGVLYTTMVWGIIILICLYLLYNNTCIC